MKLSAKKHTQLEASTKFCLQKYFTTVSVASSSFNPSQMCYGALSQATHATWSNDFADRNLRCGPVLAGFPRHLSDAFIS